MKCAPKKDKGICVLIWCWSQQALTGKTEQQEVSLPSTGSEWIWLLNRSSGVHLGCPWNFALFSPQGDWWWWKSYIGPTQNTSSTGKILHLFHFVGFFENIEFHLYFIHPRVMLYLSPNRILEYQWSLPSQKFSRIVFKGKGIFSLSEKQYISQPLK